MSQELAEEPLIKSYFLGELSESERERILERMFDDDQFFETLQIIEGELVDDYVMGRTSKREKEKLESGFFTSRHELQKINFVKTLNQYIASNPSISASAPASATSPSVFSRLFALVAPGFLQGQPRPQKRTEKEVWERPLIQAHANRNLLSALIENNWLGMELLLQLKIVPNATSANLISLLQRDQSSIMNALAHLNTCDLVRQHNGKYSCSDTGKEILEKLQKVIGSA